MLGGLDTLNEFNKVSSKPTDIEVIYYIFWEKGIGLTDFNKLPIPYILGIIKTQNYVKKLEEESIKKSNRKK